MSNKTLYDLFGYGPMPLNEEAVRAFVRDLQAKGPIHHPTIVDGTVHVGIEVEVERIAQLMDENPLWTMVEDGSLRNSGREYVSVPLRGAQIPVAIHYLGEYLRTKNPKHDFSNRTSVHIHMNARDMTVEQVLSFLITYLVFEPVLYKYVRDTAKWDRSKNIFCLPIADATSFLGLSGAMESYRAGKMDRTIIQLTEWWRKYTGLNLIPLRTQGTIEFRHMGGTIKLQELTNWINLILQIRRFAVMRPFVGIQEKIISLNTNSMYEHFLMSVFEDQSRLLLNYNLKAELEQGVITVKKVLAESPALPKELTEKFLQSSFRDYLQHHGMVIDGDIEGRRAGLQKELDEVNKAVLESIANQTKHDATVRSLRTERAALLNELDKPSSKKKQDEISAKYRDTEHLLRIARTALETAQQETLKLSARQQNLTVLLSGKKSPTSNKYAIDFEGQQGGIAIDEWTAPPLMRGTGEAVRQVQVQARPGPQPAQPEVQPDRVERALENVARAARGAVRDPWRRRGR